MQSFTLAIASIAAVAFADKPAGYATPYAPAPAAYAPAPVQAYAAPVTVIQNAATAEPTVTVTVTNGASSKVFSLGAAALAGTLAFASFM
ncbi:hypothetical protein GGH91_000533 [Coemansia sp. RSA 2671]|nr:hypothetical protein IWW57_001213 [Coemansia sp. S610]KAJ2349907.1 hypothetical protein GGH91_000533 [Coemansia sp. RSA 2671]KAJ2417561.1 hypothetical protein GGI10_000077 [Coemansia sp. RSA 2530]KAJ2698324.1 hypothetical protein H4218_003352 [Coemansia sp. IMI 209128]